MTTPSLQDAIDQAGGDLISLMSAPTKPFVPDHFPIPKIYTNWRDEQRGRTTTATMFDQDHMLDTFIKGPDVKRLLADTAVNSFAAFGPGKAKQYLAVSDEGYVIGDAVLFGLPDDEVNITGAPMAAYWLEYQAKRGGYDVSFTHEVGHFTPGVKKRFYRQMIEGPNAWKILEDAHGGPLERTGFFKMSRFTIAGCMVEALNHTMGGVIGDGAAGLELYGPSADEGAVVAAIQEAGKAHGLLMGGSVAYLSASAESGWVPHPMPAIYADNMRPFRETLAPRIATYSPLVGSFRSDRVEDYYVTPWDLGYGRMIKFDHDFIGRAALERMAAQPQRRRVWLTWNREDAARVIGSAETDGDDRAKPLQMPINAFTYDQVLIGSRRVGLAFMHGYTVNLGGWVSVGTVDADVAEGAEVELLWGEPDGGASSPYQPPHRQTKIRAIVSDTSPMKR